MYGPGQIETIVEELGIHIVSETDTNLICYCIFHRNMDSPSFSIDRETGLYLCFSPICDSRGTLLQLVQKVANVDVYGAKRLIERHSTPLENLSDYVLRKLEKQEQPEFDQSIVNRMADDFWDSPAHKYMTGRGFDDKTLAFFQIGYSKNRNLVAIPMHNDEGALIGVIGRSLEGKEFKNSKGLRTKQFLFNAHRARTHSETGIIVESATDAMLLHQYGFKNAVSTNGGFFTDNQSRVMDVYFNKLILMTDFDNPESHRDLMCKKCTNTCLGHNPGRALGEKIISSLPNKMISWASYDYGVVYPGDAKDVGNMTREQTAQCIKNAVSVTEYNYWKREFEYLRLI